MSDAPAVEPAAPAADSGDAPAQVGPPAASAPESTTDANAPVADSATEPGDAIDAGDDGSTSAPDSYADFTLPEGVELDTAALESAAPLMKEIGLSQEQAQKLVDWQAQQVQQGADKQTEAFNQLINGWKNESENDKEFGGDKFEENVSIAQSAIAKFGTPELKQLLSDHGLGNHPEFIRFALNVGRLTQEDNPGAGTSATESKSAVDLLYPKTA